MPGLNNVPENPLDALHKRTGFKVSGLNFQVSSVSRKELQ
jgi:hypothetical protein